MRRNNLLVESESRAYHTFDILTLQRAGQAAMLIRNGQENKLGRAKDSPWLKVIQGHPADDNAPSKQMTKSICWAGS